MGSAAGCAAGGGAADCDELVAGGVGAALEETLCPPGAIAGAGAEAAGGAVATGAGVVVTGVVAPAVVGAEAGGTGGAAASAGTGRAGRNPSGSRYPFGSLATRTPMYTYVTSMSGTPLGPTVPTAAPSPTAAPFETPIEPRWTSVTEYLPSGVRIETVLPLVGTVPANVTVPAVGATTVWPDGAPTSIPRCCPPAYGLLPSEKGRNTGPSTGHVHAPAVAGRPRTTRTTTAMRLIPPLSCCLF